MRNFKLLKRTGTLLLLLLFVGFKANATVIPIPATPEDSLYHFLALHDDLYADGDTIQLVDASYLIVGTPDFFHTITIMPDPALTDRPVIQFDDNGFRFATDSISITLLDLECNGNRTDGDHAPYLVRSELFGQDSIFGDITIKNVEAYGFRGLIYLGSQAENIFENVTVDNIYCHDFTNQQYVFEMRDCHIKKLKVTNSTFANIPKGFFTNPGCLSSANAVVPKVWTFEHNTFDSIAGYSNNTFMQLNAPADGSVDITFRYNVVSNLYVTDSRPFRINELAGPIEIESNVFYAFDDTTEAKLEYNLDSVALLTNVTVTNTNMYGDDPLYVDAENGDYTMAAFDYMNCSPHFHFGTDGLILGDNEYTTGYDDYTTFNVSNAYENVIRNYFNSGLVSDGDTVLLIADGGTYVMNNDAKIYVDDLVVMGDPLLNFRPTLRVYDNGFRFEHYYDSLSFTIKNVIADGRKVDGKPSNYLVAYDRNYEHSFKDFTMENCKLKNFGKGAVMFPKSDALSFENVTIDNCEFFNMGGYVFDNQWACMKNMNVTNSTFSYVNGVIAHKYWDGCNQDKWYTARTPQNITFDHNTLFHVNTVGNRMIQMTDGQDSTVVLIWTNNIASVVQDTTNGRPFDIKDPAVDSVLFSNSDMYELWSKRDGGKYDWDSIVKFDYIDTLAIFEIDPEFVDTSNFRYPIASPLAKASTTNGPIGDPRWFPVEGVVINELTEAVIVGQTVEITAVVDLPEGSDTTLTWSVADDYAGSGGAATIVDSTGLLTAVTAGQVKVTAVCNENPAMYSDTLIVTIVDSTLIETIVLAAQDGGGDPATTITTKGGTLTIIATLTPTDVTYDSLAWSVWSVSSGDATIAAVSNTTATLTAVASGVVTVTATALDGSEVFGTLDITISGQAPVDSIIVSSTGDVDTIDVAGGTLQMLAEVLPANADIDSVAWSVSDTNIATISDDGVLTAKANGTVTVTATATDGSDVTGTMDIVITNQVGIQLAKYSTARIYPNPVVDFFVIDSDQKSHVQIINLSGQVLISRMVDVREKVMISHLEAGLYIVQVNSGDKIATCRLVKE